MDGTLGYESKKRFSFSQVASSFGLAWWSHCSRADISLLSLFRYLTLCRGVFRSASNDHDL